MYKIFLALHVISVALVVGTLFLQSLAVVMALRLKTEAQQEGNRLLQRRIHLAVYYPILAVALVTGIGLAAASGAFSHGTWLHWKLVGVVLLIGLGFLTGWELRTPRPFKPVAMAVHIAVFLVSFYVIYLATAQPF